MDLNKTLDLALQGIALCYFSDEPLDISALISDDRVLSFFLNT